MQQMTGQQKRTVRDYKVLINNLTQSENTVEIFKGSLQNKFTIRYEDIVELIKQNYPQYDPDTQMCIMCYSEDKAMWQFLTKNYYHRFDPQAQEDLNIRFQVILFTEDDDMLMYTYDNSQQFREPCEQNQSKTLTIQKQINGNIQKLNDLLQSTQRYQDDITRAITYEPLDIHIFWASPYYTDDLYDRKKLPKYKKAANATHNSGWKKSFSQNKSSTQTLSINHQKNERKHSQNTMTLNPSTIFESHKFDHFNSHQHIQHTHSLQAHHKSQSHKKNQSRESLVDKSFNQVKQTVLRSAVKYSMYAQSIIKVLRQANKYTQLFIDNFNFSTFKHHNKRRFSIVYLICHTQVAVQASQDSDQIEVPEFGHKKKSKNSVQSIIIKQEKREDQNDMQQAIENIQTDLVKSEQLYFQPDNKKNKSKKYKNSIIPQNDQSRIEKFKNTIKREESIYLEQLQLDQSIQIKIESPILPEIPHLSNKDTQQSFAAQFSSFVKAIPPFKNESQCSSKMDSPEQQDQKQIQNKLSSANSHQHSIQQVPNDIKKGITMDVLASMNEKYNKRYSVHSDQTKARKQNKQKSSKSKKQPRYKYYFVGQDAHGKMVHITPENLKQMLHQKSIEIQLLLLHTSYPFYHTQIFKGHAKNIILINSNPILPDQSVTFFLERYFSHLMFYKSINRAYKETILQIKTRYPGFQCCCYHQHTKQCHSHNNMKPSKYNEYHYMYHYNRCFCSKKEFLLHSCNDKHNLATRDYKIFKKSDTEFAQEFFFCCCKNEGDFMHHHTKKFDAIKLENPESLVSQPQILDIADGKLQQEGRYLDSFCKQSQLIGNHQVIINLLKCFDTQVGIVQNKVTIFNIYGLPKTGKKYISRYFANLFIRKMVGKFERWTERQFQNIRDINKTEENIFYIFVHNPKGKNKKNLLISKKGENCIIPKTLNAIFVTDMQIMTQMGPMRQSSEAKPFEHEDQCPSYIKLNSNFSQELKNKLKKYLILTLRPQFKYYPRTFQKDQIILVLKKSKYDDIYQQFFKQCVGIPIFDLIFVAGACAVFQFKMNFSQQQKRVKKHKNPSILFEVQRIRSKSKQHGQILPQKSLINFENLALYYPLIFQKQKERVSHFAVDIIKIYAKRTMCNDDMCRFYEATTINPNSYISYYLKTEIRQIKTQEILISSQDHHQIKLHPYAYIFSKNSFQNRKVLFQSGLEFLQNALMTHTIFSYLKNDEKEALIRYGIILLNNIIIQQKNKAYYEKTLELNSSISLQIPLDQSLSMQENQTKLVNLESMNLTSRKGIIYLLDRIISHIPYEQKQSKNHLKIICEQLKIQIYFQSKYESEKLHQNFNQEIEKTVFKIVKRHQNNIKQHHKNAQLTAILQYDFVISLALLYTNCGRQPIMTKYAENMIRRAKKDNNLPSRLCRVQSLGQDVQPQKQSIKAKLLMKICGDKNLFNRLTANLSSLWDQTGKCDQLQVYEDILLKWESLSRCDPQNNPLQAHHILVQINQDFGHKLKLEGDSQQFISQQSISIQKNIMKEKFSEVQSKRSYEFQSHYLDCLLFDFQKKFEQKFNRLNKKLFVWMEANPIPNNKNQGILKTRYLIKNTLIEQFNKQSETKRKMLSKKQKLNKKNLKQLQDTKGCRFLCLDLNLNSNNQTEILGESQDSELQKISQKQLSQFLRSIPVINLFICCQKPIKLIQKLNQEKSYNYFTKDVVYFDFKYIDNDQIKMPKLNSLSKSKSQSKKSHYHIEKMIMMTFVKQIITRMHFHRQNIINAFQKTVQTLEFIDQSKKVIFSSEQLKKVAFLHCYGQIYQNGLVLNERESRDELMYNQNRQKKSVLISLNDVFEASQLQRVQQITKVCFPQNILTKKFNSFSKSHSNKSKQQQFMAIQSFSSNSSDSKPVTIQFPIQRLISALIQYLKLKQNFHNHIILDLQNCYKEKDAKKGLFEKIKDAKILDLYYTAKKGILIFLNIQLIPQKGEKWQKQQFDKLFAQPQNMENVKSHKVRIQTIVNNKKTINQVLICFFDRIQSCQSKNNE